MMTPTWRQIRARAQELALLAGDFSGWPIPIEGYRMRVANGHRNHDRWEGGWLGPGEPRRVGSLLCGEEEIDDTIVVRNTWWSRRMREFITIIEEGPHGDRRFVFVFGQYDRHSIALEPVRRFNMMMDTADVGNQAWDVDPELTAIAKLAQHVSEQQWRTYMLSGLFVEASKRSQATYVFRKGRPTVVLLPRLGPDGEPSGYYPSVALCLHPISYYEGTFAGGMVPTDDVIAHLLLMRADEHGYWRRANQHPIDRLEAGI